MRISDWSSDVCSSDLISAWRCLLNFATPSAATVRNPQSASCRADGPMGPGNKCRDDSLFVARASPPCARGVNAAGTTPERSEEHTSELQSLMRISYAVFCLKQKNKKTK